MAGSFEEQGVGRRVRRKEDDRYLRGKGEFVGDIRLAGMRELAFVRSPLAHAEVVAIAKAARKLGGWRLSGCTLYVTLEPCPMCAGAIVNARVDEGVFGAYDPKAGAMGSLYNLAEGKLNHKPRVTGGVLEAECAAVLRQYFASKRK